MQRLITALVAKDPRNVGSVRIDGAEPIGVVLLKALPIELGNQSLSRKSMFSSISFALKAICMSTVGDLVGVETVNSLDELPGLPSLTFPVLNYLLEGKGIVLLRRGQ